MVINDGVTRATRIDRANQMDGTSTTVPIEVIDEMPNVDLTTLPRVRDRSY